MRVLVCGGRDYVERDHVFKVLNKFHAIEGIDVVIQGGASGADSLAAQWAIERNIRVMTFLAEWKVYGGAAGPKRNTRMLIEGKPDLVVAFPGSDGTADMMKQALEAGVTVYKP